MDIKQQILHFYRVDGISRREISRRLKIDRKTVSRVIDAFEKAVELDPETGLDDFLAITPKYHPRTSRPRVLTGPVAKEIDKWLKENDRRRTNGMRKQCLKCKDIHRELIIKGLKVSYPSVCRYVRSRKSEKAPKPKDVFIRIRHIPGDECQFDWGEVKLFIDGEKHALMMAVFAFPYSKYRFAYLFHRQDTLAFMESHRNFFKDINGVPNTMVYDNMRVAVVFDERNKRPTEALRRLSTFYRFNHRYCNARAGWEKGDVERSVDYVRGRAFTTNVDFKSMEDAQQWLTRICDQINAEECSTVTSEKALRIEEELASLQRYPGEFGCFEIAEYKVDKQSTICIKNNHYSVPEHLVGTSVIVKMYSEKIVIYDNNHNKVATHERSYKTNKWMIDINHYIDTLMRKTNALERSEAFHQMPKKLQDIYNKYFQKNGKEFLTLIKYVRDNDISHDIIVTAADILHQKGLKHFTTDHIKVAVQSLLSGKTEYEDEQMNDTFIEIELGSDDILSQLENTMEQRSNVTL